MSGWHPEMRLGGLYPPVIVDNRNDPNSVWVIADGRWYAAPANVTLDMVLLQWTGSYVSKPVRKAIVTTKEVVSSNGKDIYIVTYRDGAPSNCTCPGYGFRGKCKHSGTYQK